jgi:hypothetical protein
MAFADNSWQQGMCAHSLWDHGYMRYGFENAHRWILGTRTDRQIETHVVYFALGHELNSRVCWLAYLAWLSCAALVLACACFKLSYILLMNEVVIRGWKSSGT